MSPVWMIEGDRARQDPELERRVDDPRFSQLAAAVRDHEAAVSRREALARPQDLHLYRRLRQICGER